VIGPNGAGKSTLLKAIYSLVTRYAGSVHFAGENVTGLRPDRLTRRGLNFVPQTDNVFPSLTLAEHVQVGALALPRGERNAAIEQVRELFPILAERPRPAGSLRRSTQALPWRALRHAAEAFPRRAVAGLSPQAMEAVFDRLVDINSIGIGIVMVEQNARRALALAHRAYVLDTGRNAIEGRGADLLHDPQVLDLYLGGSRTIASSSNSRSTSSGIKPETK
jgi:ABC-type branched-subunit amino acid transport system ATPase component